MKLFDTHLNLHSELFENDLNEMLNRARQVGIIGFMAICDRMDNFAQVLEISESANDIWCSLGIHPHHAREYTEITAQTLIKHAQSSSHKIRAIGETGLDYHYAYSPPDQQKSLFHTHRQAARQTGLPLIIHCRNADNDMIQILEEEKNSGLKLLMHCYTGGSKLAQQALDAGAFFSVSGILAFKNASSIRETMQHVPLDHMLLETDCPYLSPPPHRGKRNEPAFLTHICNALAKLHRKTPEYVAEITTQNAQRFFQIENKS